MSLSKKISTEVLVDSSAGGRCRTILRLSWCSDDPLAVGLLVTPEPDHPALPRGEWVVLRDFLRYGLEEATGDGAVRIGPDGTGNSTKMLLHHGNGRSCTITVASDDLRNFLDDTDRCVAAGAERSDEAIDRLIDLLLRERDC